MQKKRFSVLCCINNDGTVIIISTKTHTISSKTNVLELDIRNVFQMSGKAASIAAWCLHDPKHLSSQIAQTEHRLQLVSQWPIHTGSRILEIGCGQGDCTAVLASIVGSSGHVTAIDPADLSYGILSFPMILDNF